jgi:hypothetical protein
LELLMVDGLITQLVQRSSEGDSAAMECLLLRYNAHLLRYVSRRLPRGMRRVLDAQDILQDIHAQGGVAVACHPHKRNGVELQQSRYLWENRERFSDLFDAWEVANRDDLFNVVGLKKFNYIANSDFHEMRHLLSWKTLLRCEKNVESVKEAIRKNDQVSLFLYRGGKIRP